MKTDQDYLWLEEIKSEQALSFVQSESEKTEKWLTKTESYQTFYKKILNSFKEIKNPINGFFWNQYFYQYHRDIENPRGIWRRCPTDHFHRWETIIDFKELDERWTYSYSEGCLTKPDLFLIHLSDNGKDESIIREFDINKKSWIDNGYNSDLSKRQTSYITENCIIETGGIQNTAGYYKEAFISFRDDQFKKKKKVFNIEETDDHLAVYSTYDRKTQKNYGLILHYFSDWSAQYYLLENENRIKLPFIRKAYLMQIFDNELYFYSPIESSNLPAHSIYKVNISAPEVIIPVWQIPNELTTTSCNMLDLTFYITYSESVHLKMATAEWNNQTWQLNLLQSQTGQSTDFETVDWYTGDVYISVNSFLSPKKMFKFNKHLQHQFIYQDPQTFDSSGMIVQQYFARSNDGTQIPYFVIQKENLPTNTPTVLYGYGGFKSGFFPKDLNWRGLCTLEAGGKWVIANIRGGDEFGPTWHTQVIKLNRKKCYEDFAAVADDLVEKNICLRENISLWGGSNGGLLVGATAMMRPDLCASVNCSVPLLDMNRYHLLLAGSSWQGEYGTVDDSEEMKNYILSYSPFQNIKADVKYPKMFFHTSTYDDRVHPGHARKMYAKMKDLGHDVYYHESLTGGHSGNQTPELKAHNLALEFAFTWETTISNQ